MSAAWPSATGKTCVLIQPFADLLAFRAMLGYLKVTCRLCGAECVIPERALVTAAHLLHENGCDVRRLLDTAEGLLRKGRRPSVRRRNWIKLEYARLRHLLSQEVGHA